MNTQDICSVCGMSAVSGVSTVVHHKMYFHFCSEQCRENFIAHPNLYSAKVGEKRNEILKYRTMRLADPLDNDIADLLISYLMELMGVKEVAVEGDEIRICYDLLQVTEIQIEKALVTVGLQFGGGWLNRLCRSWVHNSEENELDNQSKTAKPCCNRPPPRT